ncbi:MAG: fibrobacter succinogenes major paralogous domain-containing protein [Lentimicrobiaceae bacterium]|nr:fibrobacter succinogenes major paralogous domain-containing protein [Lentimicrobiaceae bacterium]MCB9024643.1 fibrobacter succinogenes major paralogous domain-containing protein [Lentimicrobiaceae bacterium]MCO5264481.1 fibrobacter succinogenes major paralogous domain-containing protein [Lentimicrobium sp.]
MKKKNYLWLIATLLVINFCIPLHPATGQEVMNIQKKDKSIISIPVSEIEKITFSGASVNETGIVKDIEGNIYRTVQIGKQEWMAENLKTTKLNNGTSIKLVTDNNEWYNIKSSAYCWYNNDEMTNKNRYGALYNWYTINTGNLCPAGWHVSSDSDWKELEDYLVDHGHNSNGGAAEMIGKSLAAKTGWNPSSNPSDVGSELLPEFRNKSGFSALPGGFRTNNGGFSNPSGIGGYWWTSTEKNESHAWFKNLINYRGTLEETAQSKYFGCSVRCVKN